MITTIQTSRTIYSIYSILCVIYIIYKTIDPRHQKPESTAIGRFLKAALIVVIVSAIIGFLLPFIGFASVTSAFR